MHYRKVLTYVFGVILVLGFATVPFILIQYFLGDIALGIALGLVIGISVVAMLWFVYRAGQKSAVREVLMLGIGVRKEFNKTFQLLSQQQRYPQLTPPSEKFYPSMLPEQEYYDMDTVEEA